MYVTPSSDPRPSPVEHIITLAINIDDDKIIRGIEAAGKYLCEKLARTKAVKEMVAMQTKGADGDE